MGHKGTIEWGWSDENELANGFTTTIEMFGECEYHYTPGSRDIGPRYDHGGIPGDPPEIEYYNFVGTRLVVAIWKDGEKEGERTYIFNYNQPAQSEAKAWGKWFEEMLENSDQLREELDEKVSNQLEMYTPYED